MPDQRYEAGRVTIGTLLATTSPRIEVPDWQRSYSWDVAQVEAFWQDLVNFDAQYPDENIEGEEYFLGSIVLVTGGPTNLVLDGQQRLATSTILLSVLRDARRTHKADAATRLQNKYISDFDDATNTTTYVLTLNVYDREYFRADIQDEPANPPVRPAPALKSHGLVRRARIFFEQRVAAEMALRGGGEEAFRWNLRIGKVLCDHMSVVAVTSTDEDNAAGVFETLNDRGIGLSTPDLLRNLLLRRATDGVGRERIVTAWQQILTINDEANVDEYLRHYWVSYYGDVKARKLYREIKAKVLSEDIDSLELSLSLSGNAPVYRDIVIGRDDDAALASLLSDLHALDAKVTYPLLLAGYSVTDDAEGLHHLRTLAAALIAMFVRYNVIGGRETTVMETVVYNAAAQLRADKDFDAAVRSLVDLTPSGAEFVSRFRRATVSRISTARYLLRRIEQAMRLTEELDVAGPGRVHVEHIYPQTPPAGTKWPNHASMINRLGNLTLLDKRLNAAIKNGDFDSKKTNAYGTSQLLMTRALLAYDTWTPDDIDARQDALSAYVFDIWRFPGEAPLEQGGTDSSQAGEAADAADNEMPDDLPEVPE